VTAFMGSYVGSLQETQVFQGLGGRLERLGGQRQVWKHAGPGDGHEFLHFLEAAHVGAHHGDRLHGHHGRHHGSSPSEQAHTHQLAGLAQGTEAEVEGGGRAHEVHRRSHAAGGLEQGLERAIGLGVDDLARARLAGNVPLARIELHHDRWRLEHLARQADARQAHAAGANDEQRILGTECAYLL